MSNMSIHGNSLIGLNNKGLEGSSRAVHTTHTTFPATKQLIADTVEIGGKKKGLPKIQKAIAGSLAAAVLLMKGKIGFAGKEIKALAEHIEFVPAKTTEEAIAFAKSNLGIKKYSKDMPLDVMNWVNEGLVNIKNATKCKAKMPKAVEYKDLSYLGETCMAAMDCQKLLLTKSSAFDNRIQSWVKYLLKEPENLDENFLQSAKKFLEHPETFSFADKMKLHGEISRTWSPKTSLQAHHKSDGHEILYHEMGHLQHEYSAGIKNYDKMDNPSTYESGKVPKIASDFANSKEKQDIANSVSWYAADSPSEFVAETYSKLISHALYGEDKIPDRVMKLYTEYMGPAV